MSNPVAATNPQDDVIKSLLESMRRIAVVGFSAREDRASHGIAKFLDGQDFEVIGVNPMLVGTDGGPDVAGLPVVADLADIDGPIDVVDVFRRSDAVPPVIDAAIAAGAKAVWLQEGVVHEEAAARARAAGLVVIQDRCIYKEWLRLMNG